MRHEARSFDWVAAPEARLLVLGSMPGLESLRRRQYYAHPRNLFWPILGELLDFDPALPYADRLAALSARGVALWDVAHRCTRRGSMDHRIERTSIEPNDFAGFFETHRKIRAICFNGRKAEEMYRRLVLPRLPESWRALPLYPLPSPSPANASVPPEIKRRRWRIVVGLLTRAPAG